MAKPALSPPVAKRALKRFPQTVIQELATIELALGGRRALVGMLVLAPLTPDLRYVLGLLGDPKHESKSLADICVMGNVLPGDLLKHLGAAALLKGKIQASQTIGEGIKAVAEDVMRRAAPYESTCNGGCQGTGSITADPTPAQPNPIPQPCEVCHGTGRLTYAPELERQKLAIEMAQLLPKSGGIQIAQIQAGGGQGGQATGGYGSLEKLQQLTDRILYGTVEGEILEDVEGEEAAAPPDDPGSQDKV